MAELHANGAKTALRNSEGKSSSNMETQLSIKMNATVHDKHGNDKKTKQQPQQNRDTERMGRCQARTQAQKTRLARTREPKKGHGQ
jgi:hypothetical protein